MSGITLKGGILSIQSQYFLPSEILDRFVLPEEGTMALNIAYALRCITFKGVLLALPSHG
jgi:hypothetical protein